MGYGRPGAFPLTCKLIRFQNQAASSGQPYIEYFFALFAF